MLGKSWRLRTPRVTVVGAGSWGTTVASLATRNAPALLWARRPELAEQIATTHENPDYLAGLAFGALKNVVAIAAGMADGLGTGATPGSSFARSPRNARTARLSTRHVSR